MRVTTSMPLALVLTFAGVFSRAAAPLALAFVHAFAAGLFFGGRGHGVSGRIGGLVAPARRKRTEEQTRLCGAK